MTYSSYPCPKTTNAPSIPPLPLCGPKGSAAGYLRSHFKLPTCLLQPNFPSGSLWIYVAPALDPNLAGSSGVPANTNLLGPARHPKGSYGSNCTVYPNVASRLRNRIKTANLCNWYRMIRCCILPRPLLPFLELSITLSHSRCCPVETSNGILREEPDFRGCNSRRIGVLDGLAFSISPPGSLVLLRFCFFRCNALLPSYAGP